MVKHVSDLLHLLVGVSLIQRFINDSPSRKAPLFVRCLLSSVPISPLPPFAHVRILVRVSRKLVIIRVKFWVPLFPSFPPLVPQYFRRPCPPLPAPRLSPAGPTPA